MTTAHFASWGGNIAELGPVYPLVGWEVFFTIVGVILWIGWHILTVIQEEKVLREHSEAHGDRDSLTEIMGRESLIIKKLARRDVV